MNCLDYFKQLCSVPRGSGNTKQVSDLLFSFCREQGCECVQDDTGNVVAYKAGSTGREDEEPVILQAHMDMVCVAEEGTGKDLSREAVELTEEDGYIRAAGTSLGADDGIGVAMIMAVLADDTLSHPPLEAVFTVDEETSMAGAVALDLSLLRGRRLINLDDEREGAINAGCAGGQRLETVIPCIRETAGEWDVFYTIEIGGLMGGHSGCDITGHRANAARLLARILYGLSLKMGIRLCEFRSGRADNVIPDYAMAVAAVPKENAADFERLAMKHEILFRHEYPNETGFRLMLEKCDPDGMAVLPAATKSMMRFLSSVPDGLRKMSEDFPDIAQTSSNAGLVSLEPDGMHIRMLLRSSVPEELEELKELVLRMAEHDGGRVIEGGGYPAWRYRKDSALREAAAAVYAEMTGRKPEIKSTHGGLEVGIFDSKLEGLDSIAIGPDITDIHSVREKLDIGSAERTYEWLVAILGRI